MEKKRKSINSDYAANKRLAMQAKKEEKRKKVREGREDELRMKFFADVVDALGIKYRQLAKISGKSPQTISWWISTDDCKLSTVQETLAAAKVKIEPTYEPKPNKQETVQETTIESGKNFSIKISNINLIAPARNDSATIEKLMKKNGRMKFLADLINSQRMSLFIFCKLTNLNYSMVYRWFQINDIRISHMYDIANKLNQKIIWNVSPIEEK